ncbi:predicted protein [Naegleria gruberi]|uniref:Predicted protein n=1 Tax=Naegleria gruberi TaxID=5762 RepID=D2VLL4_NAEGR|nr:uncharacterized protein NAEGRDRAFT_69822 [Naegleria gruberi]EFC42409.1 predicted protein [Naegleria gruberi]|eukprot:XP_002675153.1 predicted protein [Naegleria gruberi strain NEG-M]
MEKLSESASVFKQLFNDDIATSRREDISKVMALSPDKKEITFFLPSFIVITFLQLIYGVSLTRDLSMTDFRIILTLLTLFECSPKVKSRILDCIHDDYLNVNMWPFIVQNFSENLAKDHEDYSKIDNLRKYIVESQEDSFSPEIISGWDLNFMINEFLPNMASELSSGIFYQAIHDWCKIKFATIDSADKVVGENASQLRKFLKHLIEIDQKGDKKQANTPTPATNTANAKSNTYFAIPKVFSNFLTRIEDEKIVSPNLLFKIYEIILKHVEDNAE